MRPFQTLGDGDQASGDRLSTREINLGASDLGISILSARGAGPTTPSFKVGPEVGQLNLFSGVEALAAVSSGGFAIPNRGGALGRPVASELVDYGERIDAAYKSAGSGLTFSTSGPANALGAVTLVPSTIAVDGSIDVPGEIDTYTLAVTAGETYMLSVYGSGGTALPDTFLALYDDGANLVNFDDDGGSGVNSILTFTATYTGDYFIDISGFGSATGGYTLDTILDPGVDVVPDTFVGAVAVTTGVVTYGFIDPGAGPYGAGFSEVDTYSIQVEAGKIYTIEVAGGADYNSDYLNLPAGELDPYIVVWDQSGNYVTEGDDINFPSDVSASVSFTAAYTGTYYFDAFSYSPWTGGYSVTVEEVDLSTLDPIEAFIWDSANNVTFDGSNVAYVYFGAAGENFGELADDGVTPMTTFGWNAWEMQQVMLALEEYEKILGVDYQITNDANAATFRLLTTSSTQYGAYFYPQDPAFGTQQGIGVFNVDSGGWSADVQQSLERGGFSFGVILHEFGHAHGIAHPHDTGGGSEVLAGVTGFASLGVFDLNQGVYTVMSYNDAWQTHPSGPTPFTLANIDSGWSGGLGAFDIAVLQARYGVINPYATGNDIYDLGDANDPGTFYQAIWDTSGVDTIRYTGASNARIDLMAATIDYTPTGGGVVSYVEGIWGGYTIAQGVVIERAYGGSGDDSLLGNEAANILAGYDGADIILGRDNDDLLYGLNGADTLQGEAGNDTMRGGAGADTLDGGADADTVDYADATAKVTVRLWNQTATGDIATGDVIAGIESASGGSAGDALVGSDGVGNRLVGNGGDDGLQGLTGNDTLEGNAGNDTMRGGDGADVMSGGAGIDTIDYSDSSLGVKVRLWNQTVADGFAAGDTIAGIENAWGGASTDALVGSDGVGNYLAGNGGNDNMQGLSGNDTLVGGVGRDTMTGGADADTFQFYGAWGIDRITDFEGGAGAGDVLSFVGLGAAYDTFAEIMAITTQSGANTIINFGGGQSITLLGFNMANLNADDFLFS
jgi:Ca2+-binding RTX toxin-like protein